MYKVPPTNDEKETKKNDNTLSFPAESSGADDSGKKGTSPASSSSEGDDKPEKEKTQKEIWMSQEAPFGRFKSGKPKTAAPRRKASTGDSPPPPARRAGSRVPIGQAKDPYAQLETWKKDGEALISQIRTENPNSKIGSIRDPRDEERVKMLDKPLVGGDVVGDGLYHLVSIVAVFAKVDYSPPKEACNEAGAAVAEASKYMGVEVDPKVVAITQASGAVAMLFSPIVVELVARKLEERNVQ